MILICAVHRYLIIFTGLVISLSFHLGYADQQVDLFGGFGALDKQLIETYGNLESIPKVLHSVDFKAHQVQYTDLQVTKTTSKIFRKLSQDEIERFPSAANQVQQRYIETLVPVQANSTPIDNQPLLIALNRSNESSSKSCVFPDGSGVAAPSWVCDEPVKDLHWTSVGSVKKSAVEKKLLKETAVTVARTQLYTRFKVYVLDRIKNYLLSTGNEERYVMFLGSINRTIDENSMQKVKIVETITSPYGTLFILVGLTKTDLIGTTIDVLKEDMQRNQFIWEQVTKNQDREDVIDRIAEIQ